MKNIYCSKNKILKYKLVTLSCVFMGIIILGFLGSIVVHSCSPKAQGYGEEYYAPVYNYEYYKAVNPDVAKAFGNDREAVFKHFLEFGMNEGRIASAEFNPAVYKNQYYDLRKAFGNNIKEYYIHYINFGRAEKRSGKLQPMEWTVRQYGDDTQNQYMFYTITDNRGNLVLVDGGYPQNSKLVKEVIQAYDYHVNAWIITHAHPDHVGAFNEIMGSFYGADINIDNIYTAAVNAERYELTAEPIDEIEYYERFYELTRGLDNVSYLKEGDELNLIGLDMKVFNVWDSEVDLLSDTLCNNGSLMFKISSPNKSMLFCADVEAEMEQNIIDKYKAELKADYCQAAHHGNWGLSTAFYDIVNPEAVFFDAPSYIIDCETKEFDGYLLKNYFTEQGKIIYRFSNCPNSVVLN